MFAVTKGDGEFFREGAYSMEQLKQRVLDLLHQHKERITARWTEILMEEELKPTNDPNELRELASFSHIAMIDYYSTGSTRLMEEFIEHVKSTGAMQKTNLGVVSQVWSIWQYAVRDILNEYLDESDKKKVEKDLATSNRGAVGAYLTLEHKARQILMEQQSKAIMELSTPVIQIWEEILVLPLIGAVDTARAQLILESLLEEITARQAAVVIIDITGVPVIDTSVANHLLLTIAASRTLGAESILTGVSPINAQTLAKLGVDLRSVTSLGSLQRGLKVAFEMTGNRVIRDPNAA